MVFVVMQVEVWHDSFELLIGVLLIVECSWGAITGHCLFSTTALLLLLIMTVLPREKTPTSLLELAIISPLFTLAATLEKLVKHDCRFMLEIFDTSLNQLVPAIRLLNTYSIGFLAKNTRWSGCKTISFKHRLFVAIHETAHLLVGVAQQTWCFERLLLQEDLFVDFACRGACQS